MAPVFELEIKKTNNSKLWITYCKKILKTPENNVWNACEWKINITWAECFLQQINGREKEKKAYTLNKEHICNQQRKPRNKSKNVTVLTELNCPFSFLHFL